MLLHWVKKKDEKQIQLVFAHVTQLKKLFEILAEFPLVTKNLQCRLGLVKTTLSEGKPTIDGDKIETPDSVIFWQEKRASALEHEDKLTAIYENIYNMYKFRKFSVHF